MSYMDKQRADWLASRDADDYFERQAEARDGYGPDAPHAPQAPTAEETLQRIDRICCRQLLGEISVEEAMAAVTQAIGAWTDPDGQEPRDPAIGTIVGPAGQGPRDPEYDPLQGPSPGQPIVDDDDDDIPF
jgi:hypothetical protein